MRPEPLAITAYTLTNALGRGCAASLAGLLGGESGLCRCDLDYVDFPTWIGRVAGLENEPLPGDLGEYDCRNNRLARVGLAQDGFESAVAEARARHGAGRVGLFLGTSTSGMEHLEACYRRREARGGGPLGPELRFQYTHAMNSLGSFCRRVLGLRGPACVVSTACSSSVKVFAAAYRYIAAGVCDAAVVGGVDSLCATTLYGFRSLDVVSAEPCAPWDRFRKGISIGEGAGFALLERGGEAADPRLLGYGESSDAYHMSAPHPEGAGAAQAMAAALRCAGVSADDIDYVNLHGTATPANDLAEDRAIAKVFDPAPPASSTKGWTGHTLGASGVTEAIFCLLAIEHGFLPKSLNMLHADPDLSTAVLTETLAREPRRVVTNSFGFGGSNCSLVLGTP